MNAQKLTKGSVQMSDPQISSMPPMEASRPLLVSEPATHFLLRQLSITGKSGTAEQEIFNHPGEKKQSNGLWKKQQGMVQSVEFDPKKDLGEVHPSWDWF